MNAAICLMADLAKKKEYGDSAGYRARCIPQSLALLWNIRGMTFGIIFKSSC